MNIIKSLFIIPVIISSTAFGQLKAEGLSVTKKLVNKDGSKTTSKIEIMEAKHSSYTFDIDLAEIDSINNFHLSLGKNGNDLNRYGEWVIPFESGENDIPITIKEQKVIITPGFIPTVNEYYATVKIEYKNGEISEITSFKYPPKTGSRKIK